MEIETLVKDAQGVKSLENKAEGSPWERVSRRKSDGAGTRENGDLLRSNWLASRLETVYTDRRYNRFDEAVP